MPFVKTREVVSEVVPRGPGARGGATIRFASGRRVPGAAGAYPASVGWTNPPEIRRPPVWARVAAVVWIVAAVLAAGGVVLIVLVAVALSHFKFGIANVDAYKPTAAEARAAATTTPIRPSGCAAFARVEKSSELEADATAFEFNPKASPAGAQAALARLDHALRAAYNPAQGPMQQRLRNADTDVLLARRMITTWHGVVPQSSRIFGGPLLNVRNDAYTQLRIAQRLLGRSCGGRLVPSAERVLLGPPYPMFATTTIPSVTTTPSHP